MRKDNKPKWEIDRVVAYGKEAKMLGQQYLKELEPRLPAGLMDGFGADLTQLEAMETDRPIKTGQVKGLTGSQEDIAAAGAQWAADIREAVRRRSNGAAKNDIQRRVEAAIEAIATAGVLQYRRSNPALAQRFRGLIPPAGGNGGPASPGGDQPPATQAPQS